MKIAHQVVAFDAADVAAESAFWARLLEGTVDVDDGWHMVYVDDAPRVGVQLAPDHVPPGWPDGGAQQIHLDLWVEDLSVAHQEVVAAGARMLQPAEDLCADEGFQVYADPAGHPFCLCWGQRGGAGPA